MEAALSISLSTSFAPGISTVIAGLPSEQDQKPACPHMELFKKKDKKQMNR